MQNTVHRSVGDGDGVEHKNTRHTTQSRTNGTERNTNDDNKAAAQQIRRKPENNFVYKKAAYVFSIWVDC